MSNDTLYEHLAGEAGKITWQELQPHFARGIVVAVATSLDLIDVATRFARDESVTVQAWLGQGRVAPVSDDQARQWTASNPLLQAVVVAPWVLVQESRQP